MQLGHLVFTTTEAVSCMGVAKEVENFTLYTDSEEGALSSWSSWGAEQETDEPEEVIEKPEQEFEDERSWVAIEQYFKDTPDKDKRAQQEAAQQRKDSRLIPWWSRHWHNKELELPLLLKNEKKARLCENRPGIQVFPRQVRQGSARRRFRSQPCRWTGRRSSTSG